MLPPTMSADTVSPGEIAIFNALKTAPGTNDWTVIHSLNIAKHISQVSGEVDFLIFVPGYGILCLEVKACYSLRREADAWFYGSNPTPDYRGPFKQAEGARHSLIQFIKKRAGVLRPPFFSAVAFTHLNFDDESPEWHPWQVIDKKKIEQHGVATCILNTVKAGRKHLENTPAGGWLKNEPDEPAPQTIKKLVNILRPEFEYFESPASRKKRAFDEIKRFTEEQFQALDYAEMNNRVAYTGPAGTGKTFLAIETARREAESSLRVLCLCYNQMLGDYLKQEIKLLGAGAECNTAAGFMLKATGLTPQRDNAFWAQELPRVARQAFARKYEPFDVLVIDEAQDFMTLEFIDFLDAAVKGGLKAGKVRLFGDFSAQAVQNSELSLAELKEGWMPDMAIFKLGKNCRNTPRVGHLAGGFTNGIVKYSGFFRQDDGIEPTVLTYASPDEQSSHLLKQIAEFKEHGISLEEMAVLSCKTQGSAMNGIIEMFSSSPSQVKDKLENGLICTTVRRFKGMERYGIIVTDVDDPEQSQLAELLYIASTRAVGRLTLLMHKHMAKNIKIENLRYAA
jgi:nucleoside-triphosphatase THEP1